MPTMGEGNKETVEDRLNEPFAAMLNVLIAPLLDAIRNLPSGVDASDIPWHESRVRPLAKGDPTMPAKPPVAGVIRNTLMVWFPPFETNRRLLARLTVMRSMPAHATVAPVPPVLTVPREVSTPPASAENDAILLETPPWLLT